MVVAGIFAVGSFFGRCQPNGASKRVTNVGITDRSRKRDSAAELLDGFGDMADKTMTVESFDDVYRREYRAVVGLAYALTGSRAAAEELAQDAFVTAFRNWGRIGGYEQPESWIRRVLVNNCRSRGRRLGAELRAMAKLGNRRERLAELAPPDHEFWAAVRALPDRQAQAVTLHYLEDRPLEEIGGDSGLHHRNGETTPSPGPPDVGHHPRPWGGRGPRRRPARRRPQPACRQEQRERRMIESLEERASRARQSIDEVTAAVPNRDFEPPRQHVATVAAVVFAGLLAVGGLWAIGRGDDQIVTDVAADDTDSVSAGDTGAGGDSGTDQPSGDAPSTAGQPVEAGAFLVFDPPPEGFEPMIFTETPVDTQNLPMFDVYGGPDGAAFADGDLLVVSIAVTEGEVLTDPGTPSIEVDGETVYTETDEEGFRVVSWFRGQAGVGLLSQSLAEDELIAMMTGLIRNGVLDTGDLVLLQEDVPFPTTRFGGQGSVIYQLVDREGSDGSNPADISVIAINSVQTEPSLVVEWFENAGAQLVDFVPPPPETVIHNGWTITAEASIENGLDLRFEVDGVPIHVTMLSDGDLPPTVAGVLPLLSDIRGASTEEILAMTESGENMVRSSESAND